MTPSLSLLTALPPTSNLTDPPGTNRTKRNTTTVLPLLPLGISTAHPGLSPVVTTTTPTTGSSAPESERNAQCDGAPASRTGTAPHRALAACPWTGAPIRAIVPLPSRSVHGCDVPARTTVFGPSSCWTRSAPVWDDADSGSENGDRNENEEDDEEEEEEEEEGSDEDCDATSASRCCSYESITAAEGLSAWSFEELRVECYAQSLIARGTRPSPVVQPALAIPPAFVPRFVSHS